VQSYPCHSCEILRWMGLVRASLWNLDVALLLRHSRTRGIGGMALSISRAWIGVVRKAAQM